MLLDFADFSLSNKGRLYHDLYNLIRTSIEAGKIKSGEKLPSIREAAAQLQLSRTTVENAYTKLCIEGFLESKPQKGYFVITPPTKAHAEQPSKPLPQRVDFDFSSRRIDERAADTDLWKKLVRSVLWDSGELISYGDPQGEQGLRESLAEYAYKARGVVATAHSIVIGAGIGPLLNILCGLLGREISVGFENDGFNEAKRIFSDYGINTHKLESDQEGAKLQVLEKSDTNLLFLMPSALSKISPTSLAARRNGYCSWVNKEGNRLIIEDDYNGELRYTARTVPAFQKYAPDKTVYIGSFSKLLLPSVRIAYMVLPPFLQERFQGLSHFYNQTCGKIEQLALEKYIVSGALEKHLRKLRRLYYSKSQILQRELENKLSCIKFVTLFESSLTMEVQTQLGFESRKLCELALENGVRLIESEKKGAFRLCFAGIPEETISPAVNKILEILKKLQI